ncbi:MAG: RNA polymerase sigma factor [Patescibacteria group bacterium]
MKIMVQTNILCKNTPLQPSTYKEMSHSKLERQFTKAYDQYADAIFRHCYFRIGDRERGMEMMQETFMKSWEYAGNGKEIKDMRAFLYRIANNLIVDQLRRKSRRTEESLETLQEKGFDIAGEDNSARATEKVFNEKQVVEVLGKIKEPYRSAVIMRYIDELSPKQIAEAMDESVNVVSVRINRGMNTLRSLLPDYA